MANSSAGTRDYDTGLVLQPKPEIDTNEFGMKEATFAFLLGNSKWPALEPPRGTPCNQFVAGNSLTASFLTGVSFLGAQTMRWHRGGQCPGVGILEVLCQGAIFSNAAQSARRIVSIDIAGKGAGYQSCPAVNLSGGGPVHPGSVVARLETSTRFITSGGINFQAGDVLTISGGAFIRPAKLTVDVIGTNGSIRFADGGVTHFSDRGEYSVIPGLSAVTITGGHGTGATTDLTFRLGYVLVVDGGAYTGTPTAALSGGTPVTAATLGAVTMGAGVGENADITKPFKPTSLTKDATTFVISSSASSPIEARLVSLADLGAVIYGPDPNGSIRLRSAANGVLPAIDGINASVGSRILLTAMANAAYNGIYKVLNIGAAPDPFLGGGSPWTLVRVTAMDEASDVSTAVYVHVSDGASNANTVWHCTTASITTLGVDPINFALSTAQSVSAQKKVVLEYEAIDLHFEYMSKLKLQRPRFIQNEYQVDADGLIITDPLTGEKQLLAIDSAIAYAAIVDATTGAVTFSEVGTSIADSQWQDSVRYKGTSSRFEQTPAGAVWHVLETTTIRIDPIIPGG